MKNNSILTSFVKRVWQNKNKLFAYLVLLLVAVICFLLSLIPSLKGAADVMRSLGIEFVGAVLLFFLVDFFFGNDNIEGMSKQLVVDERLTTNRVNELMKSVTQLKAIGYSMDSFLTNQQTQIVEKVRAGATIRIILMDPDSPIGKLTQSNKMEYMTSHHSAQLHIQEIKKELAKNPGLGTFEYVFHDNEPNASMILFRTDLDGTVLRVTHYPMTGSGHIGVKRLCMMGTKKDHLNWVEFYENQFDQLWERYETKRQAQIAAKEESANNDAFDISSPSPEESQLSKQARK